MRKVPKHPARNRLYGLPSLFAFLALLGWLTIFVVALCSHQRGTPNAGLLILAAVTGALATGVFVFRRWKKMRIQKLEETHTQDKRKQ